MTGLNISITVLVMLVTVVTCTNFCNYPKTCYGYNYRRCGFLGWRRCGYSYGYTCYPKVCCNGWADFVNGCNRPICNTPCYNGGTCIRPNTCKCPPSHNGEFCETLLCSHLKPCYPGTCIRPSDCKCFTGFTNHESGCLKFSGDNSPPEILDCELTLARIRRTDNKELFYHNSPCSDGTTPETFWSNQELFNYVNNSMESIYHGLPHLPPPPQYVNEDGFGIVDSRLQLTHTKYPRNGSTKRFVAFNKTYVCPGFSNTQPKKDKAGCKIVEKDYKINIEHNDVFTVTYSSKSGGFRKLLNINDHQPYRTDIYEGQLHTKTIEFMFDFIVPFHCSEPNATAKCRPGEEEPLYLTKDITKNPISMSWDGWTDGLSGISWYHIEVFELKPNNHGELIEMEPLKPIYTFRTNETEINFPTYTPSKPGMFSILLQVADKANNSKITRRLALYDNTSTITVTKPGFVFDKPVNVADIYIGDGGMNIISAIKETGYMWQTTKNGTKTRIVLDWQNHFVNKEHENGKFLNKVLKYPIQFADLTDNGVLRSQKFVTLDDHEGMRSVNEIKNTHGIVKFEINQVLTDDKEVPTTGWIEHDLTERYETSADLRDGSHVRLWVRATDIMNNTQADYTEVHIDNTPPRFADPKLLKNVENGSFTYTSRVTFIASDDGSGVHKLGFNITVGNRTKPNKLGNVTASKNNATDACATDPNCNCALNTCFLKEQTMDIDNCLFIVPKKDLNESGTITITVYNQALLSQEFSLNIARLTEFRGLEEYSGPTNIRIEKNLATGVRLVWDLPKKASCYGRADIEILLINPDGTVRVIKIYNEETSVDLVGLDPEREYSLSLKLGYEGTELAALPFSFKTAPRKNFLSGGIIAGIVIGVLVIIGLLLAIFVVLLRRGHMKPVRRGLHSLSVRYQKSVATMRRRSGTHNIGRGYSNPDSLYMYGEMDFKDIETWQKSRDDIVLESLLTSGHFADIFLANIRTTGEQVVAKTLKQGYTENDELLMKAKINFNSLEVGKHENILRFIGAVVYNSEIGPFIIYEYCAKGRLIEYLQGIKDVTLEENDRLQRFGLGIARGMEHLAKRKIVHRRLAARNILVNDSIHVKITGFGPQPDENKDGDKKRERIPIKWMAPECLKSTAGATEKSDVWSFGVVLWEIFSLGDSPYGNIKGREIPAKLKGGYRLGKPEQCEDKWYGVMKRCWSEDAKRRPSFTDIRNELDEMFVAAPVDDYYYYQK